MSVLLHTPKAGSGETLQPKGDTANETDFDLGGKKIEKKRLQHAQCFLTFSYPKILPSPP